MSANERAIRTIGSVHQYAPELSSRASLALTLTGLANEYARILDDLDDVLTDSARDQIAAANAKGKVLAQLADLSIKVTELGLDVSGGELLSRVETQLSKKEGGATTSFEEGYNPPTKPNAGAH